MNAEVEKLYEKAREALALTGKDVEWLRCEERALAALYGGEDEARLSEKLAFYRSMERPRSSQEWAEKAARELEDLAGVQVFMREAGRSTMSARVKVTIEREGWKVTEYTLDNWPEAETVLYGILDGVKLGMWLRSQGRRG